VEKRSPRDAAPTRQNRVVVVTMADADAQRDALQATPHHDPIVDEMGPEVASFLGFASATRARRVSKAWRHELGDDLARRQSKDLQMSSHAYANPIYNIRDDTFDRAFESVAWRPQVLIVQCNLGGRCVPLRDDYDEDQEEIGEYAGYGSVATGIRDKRYNQLVWLPRLMDVLRARVPPNCYIVAKTFQTVHECPVVLGREVKKVKNFECMNSPLFVSCVVLRAAKSMPRPSVFAISARSISHWARSSTFGRGRHGNSDLDDVIQLPESSVEFQRRVNESEPLTGHRADENFLDAWRRDLSRRRGASTGRPMSYRATLRSWEDSPSIAPESGLLAGTPRDLRIVKWWFLAVEHHGVSWPYDHNTDEDNFFTELVNTGRRHITEEKRHHAKKWVRLCRTLALFTAGRAPPA
jgi:hypothetical protein